MHPNGINTIYSPYVRNTAASSSTTMIVPSSSPPLDNDDGGEMVEKNVNDDADHDHSLDIQKQAYYHYNSREHPHTPLCQLHQDQCTQSLAPLNTTTDIAIPFSPVCTATHYTSSYFSTMPTRTSSTPISLNITKPTTPISSADIVASSMASTNISPKKNVKRWIVAALMILVGLLIALTFILIGLGKAFTQPSFHSITPTSSQSQLTPSPTSHPTYITATMTATSTLTVNHLLVYPP